MLYICMHMGTWDMRSQTEGRCECTNSTLERREANRRPISVGIHVRGHTCVWAYMCVGAYGRCAEGVASSPRAPLPPRA